MIESLYDWEETQPDEHLTEHLSEALDIPAPVICAMINRGVTSEESARKFMEPSRGDMHDHWLLRDMDRAAERIVRALREHERILILGDYDVDGITGTTLLVEFLESQGGHVKYYIPDRLTEGYGLSPEVLKKAHKAKYDLIVTVDTGVGSIDEAHLAKELGIDLIVTDHHEHRGDLPEALAVVNPKREDARYPFRGLAGVGVAFKLVMAVADLLELEPEEVLDNYVEIVALGTVADLVPMLDENRYIVRTGLAKMSRSRNPGLFSLIEVSHIRDFSRLETSHISFRMAPRLNAAGRLWTPRAGVELLLAKSPDRARILARKLDEHNRNRIQEEAQIFEDALAQLERTHNLPEDRVIILSDENWHLGVIGIVASKIMERYHRPVLFATVSEKPEDIKNADPVKGRVLQGSARSFKGFDMYAGLSRCSDILIAYGGHKLAAGIKIYEKDLPVLKERLNELAGGLLGNGDFKRSVLIDSDVRLSWTTRELLRKSRMLEPCGIGNTKPLFRTERVTVLQTRTVGANGNVLKLKVGQGNSVRDAVGFGMCPHFSPEKLSNELIDIVYDLQEDNFGGRSGISLKIKDLRLSGIN